MKVTPTERWLADWFNHDQAAQAVPKFPNANAGDGPFVVMVAFEMHAFAKAIDRLIEERGGNVKYD